MGKVDRTWLLFKESYGVLCADPEVLLFPLLSGISVILIAASFIYPLYRSGTLPAVSLGKNWQDVAVIFAWYYCNFFITIFFNGALIGCANIRLGGGDPTLADGFRIAFSRIGRIAVWALFASTVGLFLRSVQERGNWVLRIIGATLGLAWTLITYLIVPVLLFENRSVYDSIYRSEELFKSHWGEQVSGDFGFGLLGFLLSLPAFGIAVFCWKYDPSLAIILAFWYVVILAVVMSAIRGVFTVALYRYATSGEAPPGFSVGVIDEALGGRRNHPDYWTYGSGN